MATQLDSVQISQLKSLALGLEYDSANLDVSCIRTVAENYIKATKSSARNDSHSKSKPNPTFLPPPSNPDLATYFSHSPSSTNPPQPFCASAPELPSTVPDSHSPKREMSQSEGDTQPISQRVIEEFRAKGNLEYAERILPSTCDGIVETACETHESSACTCLKGQPGYVDLLGGFEQPFRAEREEHLLENNDEMDPLSPVANVRAELYPESKRFQQPKTPATSGKKRSENGDGLPQGDSTPRLPLNPFAGHMMSQGALMDASQAFRATQAASSPFVNALPSDAISERPSPHIYELQRPATTGPSSSPRPARSFMTRAVTEPQAKYVSIKESQEKREKLAQRSLELNVSVVVSSDEDFESDDSQLRRRRNQRKIDLKTKGQLGGITAPPRPVSSGRGRGRTRGGFGSNEHNNRNSIEASKAVITADELAPDETTTDDETEHEEETEIIFGELGLLGDDDKKNVDVPMTISRLKQAKSPATRFPSSPSRPSVNVISSAEQFQFQSRRRESFDSLKKPASIPDGTQTTAIADSQPSLDSDHVWPQPRKVRDYPRSSPPLEADDSMSPEPPPRTASQVELVGIKSATISEGVFEHQSLPTPCVSSSPARTSKTHHEVPTDRRITSTTKTTTAPKTSHSAENHSMQLPHSSTSVSNRTELIGLTGHESSKSLKESHSGETNVTFESSHSDKEVAKVGNSPRDGNPKRATTISSPIKLQDLAPQKIYETKNSRPQSNSAKFSAATPHSHMKANFLSKTPPDSLSAQASNGSTRFEPAQTNLPHSPAKSISLRQVVPSDQNPAIASPLHKSLAQILADPSPPDVIDQPNVDIKLLTGEDMEILNALHGSSPVEYGRGKRRGNAGQVLGYQKEHDRSCSPVTYRTSDKKRALDDPRPKTNIASTATERQISSQDGVSETVGRDSKKASPLKDRFSHLERAVKTVQSKSGKITISGAALSLQENDSNQDTLTGDELAMDFSTCGKGGGKGVGRSNRPRGNSPKKLSGALNSTSDPEVRLRKIKPLPKPKLKPKPKKVPSENKRESTALTRSTSPSKSAKTPAPLDTVNLQRSFVAPDRVFAHFNGLFSAYYPATCIACLAGELPRYRVLFDDGQEIEVGGSGIKRLELRKGDSVKIDGFKGRDYLVQGFADQQLPTVEDLGTPSDTPSEAAAPKVKILPMYTDVFGHATVMLVDKKYKSVSEKDAVPFSMSIRDIYVSQRMWSSFQGRPYIPTFPLSFRLETPSDTPSAPYTPSSRSCRTKNSFLADPRSFNTSTTKQRGIFTNTVFATTHIVGDGARKQLENQIVSNGGRLLGDGFDELFNIPPLELASASKKNPLNSLFRPTHTAQALGFTCLIAASHNRKPKYIQALSLGIPCLATRWVYDCISKQCLLPWQPYLLASGDSYFLAGAAHSRILPAYDPNIATLTKIVGNRPKLLEGESVLMILRPKEEEEMKFLTLIMHALGARIVAKASSLDDASRALAKHPPKDGTTSWDRVWISEHEAKAENYLFGRTTITTTTTTTISMGKKRKRGGHGYSTPDPTTTARGVILEGGKKRVIGNEYVIQSLILGQLVEGD
ncbi:hypothetical protein MMC31_002900 [Peltigera leucophlebia]|nr:hypothetical protein [Peltigera leucophlebia]